MKHPTTTAVTGNITQEPALAITPTTPPIRPDLAAFQQRVRRLAIRTGAEESWSGVNEALTHLGLKHYARGGRSGVATVVARPSPDHHRRSIAVLAPLYTVSSHDGDVVIIESPQFTAADGERLTSKVRIVVHGAEDTAAAHSAARSALQMRPFLDASEVPDVDDHRIVAIAWDDREDPDEPGTYEEGPLDTTTQPSAELAALMQRTRRLAIRLRDEQSWCLQGLNAGLDYLGLAPYHNPNRMRGQATLTVRLDTTDTRTTGLTLAAIAPLLTVWSNNSDLVRLVQQPRWVSYEANLLTVEVTVVVETAELDIATAWAHAALTVKRYSEHVEIPRTFREDVWFEALDQDPDEPGTYEVDPDQVALP